MKALRLFGEASRAKLDEILMPHLPAILNDQEKRTRIRNLLNRMSTKDHTIVNAGSRAQPRWVLVEPGGVGRDKERQGEIREDGER